MNEVKHIAKRRIRDVTNELNIFHIGSPTMVKLDEYAQQLMSARGRAMCPSQPEEDASTTSMERQRVLDPASTLSMWARSAKFKNKVAFTFLKSSGQESISYTNLQLWTKSGGIAKALVKWGAKKGDRVLLVYPPGLDFVAALIACFRLGVIAVPAYPPNPKSLAQQAGVLGGIARDAEARIALTDSSYIWVARYAATYMAGANFGKTASKWMDYSRLWKDQSKEEANTMPPETESGLGAWPVWLHWYSTSDTEGCDTLESEPVFGDDVAFLQYTSGSTSAPKGVMITYSALAHNIFLMIRASKHNTFLFDHLGHLDYDTSTLADMDWIDIEPGTIVSWLPQYHDMGLIGNTLCSLFVPGGQQVIMSPLTFLKNPLLWAEAITKYKATVITAPDFGYSQLVKYALAAGKEGTFQAAKYDFSHLRLALNGAGMIKHKTVKDFTFLFKYAGLPNHVFGGAYGLAEHCVYVCHGGEHVIFVDRKALSQGQVIVKGHYAIGSEDLDAGNEDSEDTVTLVSCGQVHSTDVDISIVDPSGFCQVAPGCIGEIWVSSPSKAGGYWKKAKETAHYFHARLREDSDNTKTPSSVPDDCASYLRTGDLGFIWQNNLYFVSRMKDLIVVHGRNLIPDDVELVLSQSHKLIRTGCVAAFQTEEDILCGVAEVRSSTLEDCQIKEIHQAVMSNMRKHNMSLHTLCLIKPRTIPKTTSGKVRRSECRQRFMNDSLDVVHDGVGGPSSSKNLGVDVEGLARVSFGEAKSQVLDYLLSRLEEMGLRVRPRDNLMESGMDSSLMVGLHKTLEETFQCDLSPSLLLDHANLYSISHQITKDIRKSNDVPVGSPGDDDYKDDAFVDLKGAGKHDVVYDNNDKSLKRGVSSKSVSWSISSLCMIAYFSTLFFFAMNVHRTIDGVPLSLLKQEPRDFFENSVKGYSDAKNTTQFHHFMSNTGMVGLRDGMLGRKMDSFHNLFLSWSMDVLPMHLFTGLTLLVVRRIQWITKRWSPAEITIGVSLCHIFALHGMSALWSIGSAGVNFLVCRYALSMVKKHSASRCRWLIWVSNLLLIGINNMLDTRFNNLVETYFSGWPVWLLHGFCRKQINHFSAFKTFRYLVLRQLSYSLDMLEEVSQAKKKGKRGGPYSESQLFLQHWAYILYGPLYMHGPCMQYRHFRASPAAALHKIMLFGCHSPPRKIDGNHSPQDVLADFLYSISQTVDRLFLGLKELAGMLGLVLALILALHTIYMPTVFFMEIHDPDKHIEPMNLQAVEYFVFGQMFLMFVFLQSHVVFGSCRAIAFLDDVHAPNDTPVSYFRSSLSVRHHWNSFHVSWRDFFLRYIFSFSNGGLEGVVLVICFSSLMHGFYSQWYVWGFLNFIAIALEQIAYSKRNVQDFENKVLIAALNQTFAFVLQLLVFIPFSVISQPDETEVSYSSFYLSAKGLMAFGSLNFLFSIFNCARILKSESPSKAHQINGNFW